MEATFRIQSSATSDHDSHDRTRKRGSQPYIGLLGIGIHRRCSIFDLSELVRLKNSLL